MSARYSRCEIIRSHGLAKSSWTFFTRLPVQIKNKLILLHKSIEFPNSDTRTIVFV